MAEPLSQSVEPIWLTDFSLRTPLSTILNPTVLPLILDVAPNDYTEALLTAPYDLPNALLPSVSSIIFELFYRGYPSGWLPALAAMTPNLTTVGFMYSILPNIDEVEFFALVPRVERLHLFDVSVHDGFFAAVAPHLRALRQLKYVYSTRAPGAEVWTLDQISELPRLVGREMRVLMLEAMVPDEEEEEEGAARCGEEVGLGERGQRDGIKTADGEVAVELVRALTAEETRPRELEELGMTLFSVTLEGLYEVLKVHSGIKTLSATIQVDTKAVDPEVVGEKFLKDDLVETLSLLKHIEQVEIILSPSLDFEFAIRNARSKCIERAFPSKDNLNMLSERCPKLQSFTGSVMRRAGVAMVDWKRPASQSLKSKGAEKVLDLPADEGVQLTA